MRLTLSIVMLIVTFALAGCVRRTISITTEPPGALVWLNDREVGRTPVTVDFLYYGTYDVRIEHEGYEPQMTHGIAEPPLWDQIPLDLVSELMPAEMHSEIHWHYVLEVRDEDPDALLERARGLRHEAAQQ